MSTGVSSTQNRVQEIMRIGLMGQSSYKELHQRALRWNIFYDNILVFKFKIRQHLSHSNEF